MIRIAWSVDARIAYQMCDRFTLVGDILRKELTAMTMLSPIDILNVDRCVVSFINHAKTPELRVLLIHATL